MRKSRRKRRTRRGSGKKGKKGKKTSDEWGNIDLVESRGTSPSTNEGSFKKNITPLEAGLTRDINDEGDLSPSDFERNPRGFYAIGDEITGRKSGLAIALEKQRRESPRVARMARNQAEGVEIREKQRARRGLKFSERVFPQSAASVVRDRASAGSTIGGKLAEDLGFKSIGPYLLDHDQKEKEWVKAKSPTFLEGRDQLAVAAAERAAAAVNDPKVAAAAEEAANDFVATLGKAPPMGGRRSRKRRRRRRRTRKKRAGFGPITTGGWIHHNLLLPSQHLGQLGMWFA